MEELKEWDNIPRMMWVWDNDEKDRLKMTVVYIIASECNFPIIALAENGNIYRYRHCAEIVKEQKTSNHLPRPKKYIGVNYEIKNNERMS